MHKANLWIINYSISIIKADNKPAISLPVYFKFVKKWKYVLRKKNNDNNNNNNNRTKKKKKSKEKKIPDGESRTEEHQRAT